MTDQERIKFLRTAVHVGILHTTTILQSTPEKMQEMLGHALINNPNVHHQEQASSDVCYIIENLQEVLNLLLDARRRLILLGLYKLDVSSEEGKTREQEIQVRIRNEVPEGVEEDEISDRYTICISPDTEMEI